MSVGIMASAVHIAAGGGPTDVLMEPFNDLTAWTNTSCTIVAGRTGTAVRCPATGDILYTIPAPAQFATATIGFAWRCDNLIASNSVILLFYGDAGATQHNQMTIDNAGRIHIMRGTSTDLTDPTDFFTVSENTWYYLEVQISLDDAAGAFTVRKNGTTVMSATAKDTRNGGTNAFYDSVRLKAAAGATHLFDDLYLTMGAPAAFKGDITIT